MVFWQKKRARSARCFYCNKISVLPQWGSLRDWTCPLCDALNILDATGNIADDIPPEYQKSASKYPISSQVKQAELSTPFCSVCTSNQALLVKTLASYLPADDDPDIAVYERAFPAYKASLEERYPPVCNSCAPNIEARLQRNNYIAKSTALGNWLKGTKSSPKPDMESSMLSKSFSTLVWALRGFLWWMSCIVTSSWYALGTAAPASQQFGQPSTQLQADPQSSSSILDLSRLMSHHNVWKYHQLMKWWFPVALLGTFWTSKMLTTIWVPRTRIEGRSEYLKLQVVVQVMRAITIYALPTQTFALEVYRRLSAFFLFVSLVHLVCSLNMLKISHQTRVNLRGAASNLKDSFPDQPEEQTDRVLVSEAQPQESFKSSVQNNNLLLLSDDEDEDKPADEEVDTMDWQPQQDNSRPNGTSPFTNTATSSGSIPRMFPQPVFAQPREQYFSSNPAHRSPFQLMPSTKSEPMRLAKQRFFAPERPTGLENLFSAAVTLDDEPLLVRSIKSVQRTPTAAAWSSLVFSMALFVPLVLGHPEIMAVSGTVILLMDAYFGLLPRVALASVLLWPLTWAITRALLHYNSGLRATFLPASYCTSFALHMGVQGWALYTVLQRRKRQTKRRTGKSKKLL